MKKVIAVVGIILLVVIAGIFFIHEKELNTDVTKEKTKVGMLMLGAHDDRSFNQTHYEAMEKTAKKLNLTMKYKENVSADDGSKEAIDELIAEGCKIIICNSYDFGTWAQLKAEENPEIYFFHASGIKTSKNLATYFGRMYQMRYLSGIVAGLQTETNEIGYVAAFPISEVNRGINAFALGVRSVNPEATVHVTWCKDWNDDEAARAGAQKLFAESNMDVITMHTDSNQVLEFAEEKGIWSIGYHIDNSEYYPNTFLTAPVWQWEKYYEPYILKCLQGKFEGENYWEGTSTEVVGLAPLTDKVKPGVKEKVTEAQQRLDSGMFDVFYGPVTDNQGKLRVAEGENLSDDAMLNHFTWYVEGVVLHE